MKLFDYSSGKKGDFLSEAPRPSFTSGMPNGPRGGYLRLTRRGAPGTQWTVQSAAGRSNYKTGKDELLTPEAFGVEAICGCLGEWRAGTDAAWEWFVIGTEAWLAKALAAGWIKE